MNGLCWIITEIEGKVPSLTGLATSAGLTSLKNKLAGFSNLVKKTDYGAKTSDIESKYFTTSDYNKFTREFKTVKTKAFDSSYFCGKNHFEDGGTQSDLVLEAIYRYFKKIGNSSNISAWKPKWLSDKRMTPPIASGNILAPSLNYIDFRARIKLAGQYSGQEKVTFTRK